MRIQFNSGRWTDEEHQGFLRGLEVYGRCSWGAIGIFVPARSPLQIEEHAMQHFAEGEIVAEEVQIAQRAPSRCCSSSSSSCLSRNVGCSSGGCGGDDGSLWEPPVFAHLAYGVPVSYPEDELFHHDIRNGAADGVLGGLVPVASDAVYAQQQQQQASMHGELYQAGEPIENLVAHGIPYPNPRVWEEPALGKALRNIFALEDFCGVL